MTMGSSWGLIGMSLARVESAEAARRNIASLGNDNARKVQFPWPGQSAAGMDGLPLDP